MICGVAGVALLIASVSVTSGHLQVALASLGALVVFVAVLLPALTEFEIDVFVFRATANPFTREHRLNEVCQQEAHRVASLARLVGVDPGQVSDLVDEAVEDTCRLWRGRIVDDLVHDFVMCRAVHIVRTSVRLGGPYQVTSPAGPADRGPGWGGFASLPPQQRLAVALAEYAELDDDQVAAMLDLDRTDVRAAVEHANDAGGPAGGVA